VLWVQERQRSEVRREGVGEAVAVPGRLELDARQGRAGLLGLDDPRRPAIEEEDVVGEPVPGLEWELADRDTP
jgi:hypothetical protein